MLTDAADILAEVHIEVTDSGQAIAVAAIMRVRSNGICFPGKILLVRTK